MSGRSVVICGSKRHATAMADLASRLRSHGVLVFEPNLAQPLMEAPPSELGHVERMAFKGLTLEHFEWVRRADLCLVYNPDDYCGVSVSLEMGFAFALGKTILATNPHTGDPCRDALIDFVVPGLDDLLKLV